MSGPDFFILGAMKSGTTTLFDIIGQHPQVCSPVTKELHYYNNKRYGDWNLDKYRSMFPEKPPGCISGEATPFYLRHQHAPKWVFQDFPNAKLLAILRNPTDRAYSHYQQRFAKGKETEPLLDLVQREDADMADEWQAFKNSEAHRFNAGKSGPTFLSRGRYAEQIQNWTTCFPPDRLHVLLTEDLITAPEQAIAKVFDHLGLPPANVECATHSHKGQYTEMPQETRAWLDAYFAPYNATLAKVLGRRLPWNTTAQ
ncbi:MAG: sulfotransferase domain-containing protein [Sulfitobacter sp.]